MQEQNKQATHILLFTNKHIPSVKGRFPIYATSDKRAMQWAINYSTVTGEKIYSVTKATEGIPAIVEF